MTFPETRFTELVGCRVPIQQAGMGGVSTPELAAAVGRAGGLGMLGAAGLDARVLADQLAVATTMAGPDARVGVNFLVPFLDMAALEVAATHSSVVECFYGDPDASVVGRIHAAGALACWQVGSRDEALAAEGAGCDVIVIQGVEAGGHIRGTTPLLELLEVVHATSALPLVAAGGIATGAAIAAVLEAGADAARIGTRLVATLEADVHPGYADALVRSRASDTVVSEAFSMGWPAAPHRVLRSCVEALDADPATRSPLPPTRSFTGTVEEAALYAGTSVDDIATVEPAEALIRRLTTEAGEALHA